MHYRMERFVFISYVRVVRKLLISRGGTPVPAKYTQLTSLPYIGGNNIGAVRSELNL